MSHHHPRRTTKTAIATALLGTSLLAGGCHYFDREDDTAASVRTFEVDLESWRSLGLELSWSIAGRSNADVEAIDPEGDVLITVDERSVVTVREDSTGAVRWSIQPTSPSEQFFNSIRVPNYAVSNVDGTVTNSDAVLVVGATEIFAYDLISGALLERYAEPQTISTPGLLAFDRVIVGTVTGRVISKRLLNGVNKWSYNMSGAVQGRPVRLAGGQVGVVSAGGEVLMIDSVDGDSFAGPLSIFGGIETDPVSDGGTLYVASMDHSIYAFDVRTSERIWRVRTQAPLLYQPSLYDGALYVTTEKGLTAYNAQSGEELWTSADVEGEAVSTVRGDLLVFTGSELVLVDPGTGAIVDRISATQFEDIRADGFENADLYAVGRGGAIAKFTVR